MKRRANGEGMEGLEGLEGMEREWRGSGEE